MYGQRTCLGILLIILALTNTVLAASPTSFCKCTCFSNSTIIPLSSTSAGSSPKKPSLTCTDCNRQFCLSYNLPICKGAKEEDVFTTCFQRDSAKDEAVVFIFIAATVGLLVWASIRPWVGQWGETRSERRDYVQVESQGD
ncbi:hypothetical protein BJ546DRAFT_684334 [Cryomyces antarcticus]